MTNPDAHFMVRAIELAGAGLGRVSPNPPVGCVIVTDDTVVGEGYHAAFGEAHAEVNALAAAGSRAEGATAYVTLMPCNHHGKTPPCTEALISSGITRVVVAVDDPDPVSGNGAETLRNAGITVETGIERGPAMYLMRGFLKHLATGRPFITLKYAMTMDGKIATHTGESKWISSELSRECVQKMRSEHDAVMIGIGTALADDPRLNVRNSSRPQPQRVIIDSTCRLPVTAQLFKEKGGPVIVFTTSNASPEAVESLTIAGAEVIVVNDIEGRVNPDNALSVLSKRGIRTILCEGGSGLAWGLINEGLVDEVASFVAPKIVGGEGAPGPVGGKGESSMQNALALHHITSQTIGGDICIRGRIGEWGWEER